jgi:hypothetical protein
MISLQEICTFFRLAIERCFLHCDTKCSGVQCHVLTLFKFVPGYVFRMCSLNRLLHLLITELFRVGIKFFSAVSLISQYRQHLSQKCCIESPDSAHVKCDEEIEGN